MDAEALTRLIAVRFPDLAGLVVTPLRGGGDHDAFDVGGRAVMRIRRDGDAAAVRTEADLCAVLAPLLPLPVPEHRWLAPPVIGAPRLPGEPALTAPRVDVGACARAVGATLRVLHRLDPPRLAAIGVPQDLDPSLGDWREGARASLVEVVAAGALTPSEAAGLGDVLREPPAAVGVAPRPVHGDLAAEHVQVDADGRPTAIIDWGDACLGDPARDLAGLVHWGGVPMLAAAEAEYGPVSAPMRERALWYATCRAVEDIAFGCAQGRPAHVAAGRSALARLGG